MMKQLRPIILISLLLSACSTTKNLPEGEILYTGQKKMKVENPSKSPTGSIALEEIGAALATPPNNSLLGSSTVRIPFPIGLWIYNRYVNSHSRTGKLMFKKFAAKPVFISAVNPDIRVKVSTNLLHDYGYFNGTVSYEQIPERNPRKAKLQYTVDMKDPYLLDSIMYERFSTETKDMILASRRMSVLRTGDQFSVDRLEEERQRLSTLLRNRGYYYFRPEFIGYRADTTRVAGKVSLQVVPQTGLPPEALQRWYIGNKSVRLYGVKGEIPKDSLFYKDILIYYDQKLKVRPEVLYKSFRFKSEQLFSERHHTSTQDRFIELGIFRYAEIQYKPRDSTKTGNILDAEVRTTYDLKYDSELELNVAAKSNDQTGPGAAYSLAKRNVFGGGETFSIRLRGSYEWQTNSSVESSGATVNSYELGLSGSLSFPCVVFPRLGKRDYDFPAVTTFRLNAGLLNRARFFKMLSFGGEAMYMFQPGRTVRHTVTPFKLTFNTLQQTTERFNEITNANPALFRSLENQFVPSMSYTYTYDNATLGMGRRRKQNLFRFETSITSAGNVTSAVYAMFGQKFSEQKELLGTRFAQFLKLTGEMRYTWIIDKNQSIATRLGGGIICSYGNSEVSPYSEQFYVGGANSIRAFTVRGIGPGSYRPEAQSQSRYSYMDQTGDIKLEGNIEYRFRIVKDLHGAIFLDAGNIWMLRDEAARPGGQFNLKNPIDEIALGTGAGLRYDLSVLVIRIDCGVALHTPYKTSRSGYYNIPKFKDGLGIHLAVGYPF